MLSKTNANATQVDAGGATRSCDRGEDARADDALCSFLSPPSSNSTETPITNSLDTPSRTHTTNGTASTAATAGDGRPSLSRSVPSTTPDSSLGASRPESPASTHGHWNSTISELTQEVVRAARSFDPPLWYECEEEVRRQVQEATQRQTQQQRRANAKNKAAAAASAANAAANDTRQRRQDARPLDTTVNLNAAIAAVKASTKAHTSGKAWDS